MIFPKWLALAIIFTFFGVIIITAGVAFFIAMGWQWFLIMAGILIALGLVFFSMYSLQKHEYLDRGFKQYSDYE